MILPQDHNDENQIALLLLESSLDAQLRTPLQYLAIDETLYPYRG